jgi:twitching motility protein PilT
MAKSTKSNVLDSYLQEVWDRKGTDLLLTAGAPPMARIDGLMQPMNGQALQPEEIEKVVTETLSPELLDQFNTAKEIDFSFNWQGQARFRVNCFRQRGSMSMALRLIPFAIPNFDDLGLPPIVERFVKLPHGLILVTGPTGSGKSTTLAAMIDYINKERALHILTIEDPIEYVHHHNKSAVNQREIGEDTISFQRALRSALREDPDVLLVGEMRDLETIQFALTIAETGHLVFATLHTNDTAQALDRIVDVFPAGQQSQIRVQLANSLAGIIYQQLLPRSGEEGRVATFEVLVANHAIRNLIKEGKTRQIRNIVATSTAEGMQTLETSLTNLVQQGIVNYDDAVGRSLYPNEIKRPVTEPEEVMGRKGRLRRR